MTVSRRRDHPVFMLQDPELSWAAKGVMSHIFLVGNTESVIDSDDPIVFDAFNELVELGYLEREKELDENCS